MFPARNICAIWYTCNTIYLGLLDRQHNLERPDACSPGLAFLTLLSLEGTPAAYLIIITSVATLSRRDALNPAFTTAAAVAVTTPAVHVHYTTHHATAGQCRSVEPPPHPNQSKSPRAAITSSLLCSARSSFDRESLAKPAGADNQPVKQLHLPHAGFASSILSTKAAPVRIKVCSRRNRRFGRWPFISEHPY